MITNNLMSEYVMSHKGESVITSRMENLYNHTFCNLYHYGSTEPSLLLHHVITNLRFMNSTRKIEMIFNDYIKHGSYLICNNQIRIFLESLRMGLLTLSI